MPLVTGLKPTDRVGIFIDGANLYATTKACGFDIDFKKMRSLYEAESNLVRAFYYTALIEDEDFSSIRPLIDWLDYNGYAVVTKPTKEFIDSSGRRKIKGNMDIELAIDALELAPYLDEIVLFTGDGDFRKLVDSIQRKGRRVTVVSALQGGGLHQPMIADELRRQADKFVNLNVDREGSYPAFTQAIMRPIAEAQERARQRAARFENESVASFGSQGDRSGPDVVTSKIAPAVVRRGMSQR
jgi:uncharacterized LabA/DUF88 family protein